MKSLACALVFLGTVAFVVPVAQQAPPATGLIIGRIVEGGSGTPVTSAIVTLTGAGLRPRRVLVDGQGRFMFSELPAGAFTIAAARTGFLDGTYGKLRPDGEGRTLDLQAGERVTDATIQMWRYATISGSVIDDAGDPVMGARVQALTRAVVAGQWRLVNAGQGGSSDERGAYRIPGLVPGAYALVITAMNSTLPMSLLSAADAQRTATGGVIPDDLWAKGTAGFLNDLMQGFAAVKAGDFLLQTSADRIAPFVEGQPIEAYPTVWYPSAGSASTASLVTVQAGEDRTGVNLRPTLTRTYRVSGTVSGPDGPMSHLALRLVPVGTEAAAGEIPSSLALSLTTAMTSTDANGAFTFLIVPPGQYLIRALMTPRGLPEPSVATVVQSADGMKSAVASGPALPAMVTTEPSLWATMSVSVASSDATNVHLQLRPGVRMTGRVAFEGNAAVPDGRALRSMRATMEQADGRTIAAPSAYQAQIDPNGRFYTIGLVPGSYVLRIDNVPRGWYLRAAMSGSRDISDMPITLENDDVDGLVVTFSDRMTTLAGTVRDGRGRPDVNATVLVFPTDGVWTNRGPNPRRMRSVRASRSGEYSISGLPAGDYWVIAVSDAVATDWQEPAFLQQLSRLASRVNVLEGQSTSALLSTVERTVR